MSSDNVTPFRRPKPTRPQQQGGWGFKTHRGKALLVQFLTFLAFLLNLFGAVSGQILMGLLGVDFGQFQIVLWIASIAISIAAVALAFSNRGQGMPWANTHHEHALRTLILGYSIWTLGSALSYINGILGVATIFIQLAVVIWAIPRALIGMALASARKPIPNPRGWFI